MRKGVIINSIRITQLPYSSVLLANFECMTNIFFWYLWTPIATGIAYAYFLKKWILHLESEIVNTFCKLQNVNFKILLFKEVLEKCHVYIWNFSFLFLKQHWKNILFYVYEKLYPDYTKIIKLDYDNDNVYFWLYTK